MGLMAAPPPVPPRPAELRYDYDSDIVSPRPHRTDNPAAQLSDLAPPPPPMFSMPAPFAGPISTPPTYTSGPSDWSPWAFSSPGPPPPPPPPMAPTPTPPPNSNSLTATLPSIPTLLQALPSITAPGLDGQLKVNWARDVFFLADRAHHLHLQLTTPVGEPIPSVSDPIVGPLPLSSLSPELNQLVNAAVPLVLDLCRMFPPGASYQQNTQPMESFQAEAVYMRAVLASTGAHPQHVAHSPKAAFRDFESAARGGYAGAWFRLGRDYETFDDHKHARDCFERGAKLGVEACLYRLGMAHLLGQLGLPGNVEVALPILQRSAALASLECPQPAYVYSLLLLNEFASIPPIPSNIYASLSALTAYPQPPTHPSQPLQPLIPLGSSPHLESRHHLERAAYLHYGPAQYKLGHAYEFADPPFYFDPLLSVQYYSLASQNGEVEADMALSKWFLCGSPPASSAGGAFDKDEGLALTFAQKASARNLPSAHFAMGYYAEVGVGRPASRESAIHFYTLAWNTGANTDAKQRLDALTASNTAHLDRKAHEQKLERTRTMAQRRTEEQPMSPPFEGRTFPSMQQAQLQGSSLRPPVAGRQRDPRAVVELVRKNSMATSIPGFKAPPPPLAATPQAPQQQQQHPGYASPAPSKHQGYASPKPASSPAIVGSGRMPGLHGVQQGRPGSSASGGGGGRQSQPQQQQQQQQSVRPGYASPAPSTQSGLSTPVQQYPQQQQPGAAGRVTPQGQNPGPRRGQSPAGLGRQGKLSVGVDVPPVPNGGAGAGAGAGAGQGASLLPNTNTVAAGHTPRPSKHPATFAEMGIQGAKAEDKECVVM